MSRVGSLGLKNGRLLEGVLQEKAGNEIGDTVVRRLNFRLRNLILF